LDLAQDACGARIKSAEISPRVKDSELAKSGPYPRLLVDVDAAVDRVSASPC
jgi:hypothetical protein